MRNKKVLMIIAIALSLIIILGSSYAYLRVEKKSGDQNISIANFGLVIKEDMKEITLDKQVPKSDEEGLKNTPNTFKIENQGDVTAKYRLSLIDGKVASTMSNLDIRYRVKRTRSTGEETGEVKSLGADGVFDEGVIASNEEISFELVIWINHDANPNGLIYNKVLSLEGLQADTLDTSGANPPEMLDNMIPVYYSKTSDTDGVWKVADITNRDESHKWYDYNDFMWANAVTVKESNGTLNDDGSMSFDGVDDYYDLGHSDYDFKDKISIVTRIKSGFKDTMQVFVGKTSLALGFTESSSKKIYFSIHGESWHQLNSVIIPNSDEWYTIVATYDGNTQKIYVNGELDASMSLTENIEFIKDPILLGAIANRSDGQYSNVTISDAFVYTDALTADEVSKYFNGEITDYPKDNLLVAKTEFNELDARQKYLEASAGTEVKMDDISSMWVWIPRYRYTIFNGNNETSEEQMINVEFEKGIESTGTVSCHDDIQTDDNSNHSEICEDKINNGIVNGKSTYTHPAFTFGDEELVGFWFAKFEMSTDNQECLLNQSASCNKDNLNILVKPDQVSLRYIINSNMFINIRSMELYNNIHGFSQNSNATSYLDSNNNLSGVIKNDDNNYDIHMLKNMEWGAVAYLSFSKYGKQGNDLYNNNYKNIYSNTSKIIENNILTIRTGYSNNVLYNNLTIENVGEGYKGAGASTTGTIYGIFDMVGGSDENVMAVSVTKDGSINIGKVLNPSTNMWDKDADKLLSKYYDKYSYFTSTGIVNDDTLPNAISRQKLGDATKETFKTYNNNNGSWNSDYGHAINAWLTRGIEPVGGLFSFWQANTLEKETSRPVLTISRDFPWKD